MAGQHVAEPTEHNDNLEAAALLKAAWEFDIAAQGRHEQEGRER